jgi:hypothetical protein
MPTLTGSYHPFHRLVLQERNFKKRLHRNAIVKMNANDFTGMQKEKQDAQRFTTFVINKQQ